MSTEVRDPETVEAELSVPSPIGRRIGLTVDLFYKLHEAGILGENDPISLWKGCLVETMTKNQPHVIALGNLNELLMPMVPAGSGYYLAKEDPIALADDTLPEPDLTLIRGSRRDYPHRPPAASNVALLVEVSDTSLAEDRGEVLREYARQGIPVYWIVNIPGRRIEVYTEPIDTVDPPLYRAIRHYMPGEAVPVILDGREVGRIAVRDVLP